MLEAKARIEHPEDMILDGGVKGAQTALKILQITADQPQHVSLKFDGSPSLIMGWRGPEFILTDKAGFSAKGYDGMTTSGEAIESMIMNRKMRDTSPEAVQARKAYAGTIASLYDRMKQVVPRDFPGFAQGDLMWTQTPPVVQGAYEFAPVKIKYRVPTDTDLGKKIGASQVGMVIHSVYDGPQDEEPEALRDVKSLGFKDTSGVLILPHELTLTQTLSLDPHGVQLAEKLLSSKSQHIQAFLDPLGLADQEIKALPGVMKSFVAYKAGKGEDDFHRAPEEFIEYVQSPTSKVSAKMQPRIISWIQNHVKGYNAIWQFIQIMVGLKMDLKRQIDAEVGQEISASLRGSPGHEGFVSVTPEGIVKLVNRAEFMRKDLTESVHDSLKPRVVFSFIRANPPTPGHVKVVDAVSREAKGDDYWVFLSQSQDAKKNPLSWADKLHYLGKLMPGHKSHLAVGSEFEKIKTPLLAADWLYDQGYRDFVMVVGSDRVDAMRDLLDAWNSDPIREKFNREPVLMRVISAGDRDPDAEDVSGMSASKMRHWASEGDEQSFVTHSGLPEADAQELYHKVRTGLKLKSKSLTEHTHASGTIVMLELSDQSAQQLHRWCQQHDVPCIAPSDLHMTVMFSVKPMSTLDSLDHTHTNITATIQHWQQLGQNALTLKLTSPDAVRLHRKLQNLGAVHSYADFIPHTSVNYENDPQDELPSQTPEFTLVFDTIRVKPIDPKYAANSVS